MRHKFLVLPVKKMLKSVHIYGSYRKIKTGVPFFLQHPVHTYTQICKVHNVCQLIESEAWAVTGGITRKSYTNCTIKVDLRSRNVSNIAAVCSQFIC